MCEFFTILKQYFHHYNLSRIHLDWQIILKGSLQNVTPGWPPVPRGSVKVTVYIWSFFQWSQKWIRLSNFQVISILKPRLSNGFQWMFIATTVEIQPLTRNAWRTGLETSSVAKHNHHNCLPLWITWWTSPSKEVDHNHNNCLPLLQKVMDKLKSVLFQNVFV